MLTPISPENTKNIAPLYAGWDETLIWSCLQGHMGRAWADDADAPSAARIIVGDFCFFAGDAGIPAARELVQSIPTDNARDSIIMIPKDASWHRLIEDVHKDRFHAYMRYAIKKEPGVFDKATLQQYASALPEQYRIVPIDRTLYHSTQTEGWSGDFCSQFATFEDYEAHGAGFVVLYDSKPVCGASSYTYYSEGIEIEICTIKEHRRRGLATACAASLILECLNRGLYPSWDAANRESVALAEKLGYHFEREYMTYDVKI